MLLQGGGGVMWDLPNCGGRYLARNDAQPAEEHRRQHPEVGNTYQLVLQKDTMLTNPPVPYDRFQPGEGPSRGLLHGYEPLLRISFV